MPTELQRLVSDTRDRIAVGHKLVGEHKAHARKAIAENTLLCDLTRETIARSMAQLAKGREG